MNASMLGQNLLVTTQIPPSGLGSLGNFTGDPQGVLLFNRHSYQVVAEGPVSGKVSIQTSNTKDGPFSTMIDVLVDSGNSINVTSGQEAGFVYSAEWNMVRSRIVATGLAGLGLMGDFTIYENHIY
jgi:hypothetical protein